MGQGRRRRAVPGMTLSCRWPLQAAPARHSLGPHHRPLFIVRSLASMAKLRHIAIIVPDPEAAAAFFERAFDFKRVGKARRGIYVSDGTINVALLKIESEKEKIGLYHFGMWVDDLTDAEKQVTDA